MLFIQTYNSIAKRGLAVFSTECYKLNEAEDPDAILLRSYSLHNVPISPTLKAVARAGAGVNNIPVEKLSELGVVVFNTPGANANAVKELALMSVIATSRHFLEAANWTKKLVGNGEEISPLIESGKKQFVGTEIQGKRLGVIGLGAIGGLVANDALALGMEVMAYDPFISVNIAWQLSSEVKRAESIEEIYKNCDYITLHVPLTDETRGMLNHQSFSLMKDGVHILNFSRGELVLEDDLEAALKERKIGKYITDFPTNRLLSLENTVVLPHIGASTKEAEENCAQMAANVLKQFLETGNIRNSINFPNVNMPYTGKRRLTITHRNIPNMVGQITTHLAVYHLNIADMINRSKGVWAYTMIDIDNAISDQVMNEVIHRLKKISGVKKVRFL
ncbi:phosphoglycerate dehydrogenase [Caldibacillus lycopersici]|uniref:D-3-phosphoglycerate dehydrogenase n=1 Tax=Perspicuibacillus lycopersici TaxID=1325689 RepID=A0AAE3LMK1_9BACI|nr:phosphoglycerate dehydrogenase [Perspicuibacillus lycopersici]MCU9612837.1 phosphoglycerate dehydrogenase [Perspicuibacillus lycopersici]